MVVVNVREADKKHCDDDLFADLDGAEVEDWTLYRTRRTRRQQLKQRQ